MLLQEIYVFIMRRVFTNFVAGDYAVGRAQGWRHPGHSDSLRGKSRAGGIMRWLLGYAFRSMLPAFLAHRSGADLVECLNDHSVLRVSLEIHDLQMMFLRIFLREFDSLKHVRLVR